MKYLVKSPIDHDQVRHEPGAEVELTDEQAAPLVSASVVEAIAETNSYPPKTSTAGPEDLQKDASVVEAALVDGALEEPETSAAETVIAEEQTAPLADTEEVVAAPQPQENKGNKGKGK